jgi:hypothetical protein
MESIGKEISIIDNDLLEKNIKIVMSQTTYSYDESKQFLLSYNNDYMKVIREYLGVKTSSKKITSVNQEIYKQLRVKLDSCMRDFNIRKENNETRIK